MIFSAVLVALITSSCSNEPEEVGLSIQPESDRLSIGYDTSVYVRVYSEIEKFIRTDRTSLSSLGSMWDPYFGKTTAAFYTQFRLSQADHEFGDNAVVDSVVLKLLYAGSYGDSLSPITVSVHEITDSLELDSVYYSTSSTAYNPTPFGEYTFVPKIRDSVLVDTTYYAPQLWLNLTEQDSRLADILLNANMGSNTDFLKDFPGLYISAAEEQIPGKGQIVYFTPEAAASALYIYYHNDNEDSLFYTYPINSNCARYNTFEHYDYQHAAPELRQQIVNKDTATGDQIAYLQGMAGIRMRIQFPDLSPLTSLGNITINEAKLVFENADPDEELYFAPPSYVVYHYDENDTTYKYITDQYEGTLYFGGNYNFDTDETWMRITTFFQSYVDGDTFDDLPLYLAVSGSSIKANRLMIYGGNPAYSDVFDKRIRLEIVYSKVH